MAEWCDCGRLILTMQQEQEGTGCYKCIKEEKEKSREKRKRREKK